MKKIVRLTERDLTRIVKRVINERDAWNWAKDTGSAIYDTVASDLKNVDREYLGGYCTGEDISDNAAYQKIYQAMRGGETNETAVRNGCALIKNQQDYNAVLSGAKQMGYKTVMGWIGSDISWMKEYDKTMSAPIKNVGGYQDQNRVLEFCSAQLRKFSSAEKIGAK